MMCPIQCMIFSETALVITSLIKPEVKTKKQCNLWLNHEDMSDIFISESKSKPIVCEGGYIIA